MKRLYVLSTVFFFAGSLLAQRNSPTLSTTSSTHSSGGVTSSNVSTGKMTVNTSSSSSSNTGFFSTYTPPPNNNDRDNYGHAPNSGNSGSSGSSGSSTYNYTSSGGSGYNNSGYNNSGYNGSSYNNYNNSYYGSSVIVGGSGYNPYGTGSSGSYTNNSSVYIPPCATCYPNMYSPPTRGYRVHFSGKMFSDNDVPHWTSIIWQLDDYSEMLGVGKYPYIHDAVHKSVEYTFDGIAVDSNVRIVIYSQQNFQGNILLDVTGPAIINNSLWIDRQDEFGQLKTKTYSDGGLQNEFPPENRQWSYTDMHDWQNGSMIISEAN
jgi:hypothetical protein